jgi:hypothetical protein
VKTGLTVTIQWKGSDSGQDEQDSEDGKTGFLQNFAAWHSVWRDTLIVAAVCDRRKTALIERRYSIKFSKLPT